MYGTMLSALEPSVRAATLNVEGGTETDIARWSPAYNALVVETLAMRMPSLLNEGDAYNEDYAFPGQPALVITVPDAIAIQNEFEILEWLTMIGDPMAFAPHLKLAPLAGLTAHPTLMQFAPGDMMPNPATSDMGNAWEYRHDLARAVTPGLPADPHPYLVLFANLNGSTIQITWGGRTRNQSRRAVSNGWILRGGWRNHSSRPDLSCLLYGVKLFQAAAALPLTLGF
jgi:hypothetical protein